MRYITGKSPVAGVSAAAEVVDSGVALLWAVTTSTLAAVSFTLTVDGVFWAREVELVGVAVACAAAVVVFKAPQAASSVMTAIKKAAQKKAFHRENASLISVFSFYRKRCSNVPS